MVDSPDVATAGESVSTLRSSRWPGRGWEWASSLCLAIVFQGIVLAAIGPSPPRLTRADRPVGLERVAAVGLTQWVERPIEPIARLGGAPTSTDGALEGVGEFDRLPLGGRLVLASRAEGGEWTGMALVPSGTVAARSDLGLNSLLEGGKIQDGSWSGLLKSLRRHGLDIVIVFDSTGSMGGEILEVKRQIARIGATLRKLVPNVRIGMVTYRDLGDAYVSMGVPLTSELRKVESFLALVGADGGGDEPEAVQEGMKVALRNGFRDKARKVVLIFGDAPPHPQDVRTCLGLADSFHREQQGIISTVTCRRPVPLPEFDAIARSGGGEAYLSGDQNRIMEQLIVLVFGGRHREKVLEAFDLMNR